MANQKQVFRPNIQGGAYREDVLDVLFEIDPTSTPFWNMIGTSSSSSVMHQWGRRSLTLRQDNAKSEGVVYTAPTDFANPVLATRTTNWCQIFSRLPMVTGTQEAMNAVGIGALMADQVNYHMVGIKTDQEHALLRGSLNSGPTNNADTSVRRLGGVANVMTYTTALSTNTTFRETVFNNFHENGWNRGASLRDVLVHGRIKRWISSFTASSTKYIFSEDKRLVNSVDVYESDFYLSQIHLSHDVPPGPSGSGTARAAYFIDRDFFKKSYLRRPSRRMLPVAADATYEELLTELTLEYGHPAAGTTVTDIQKGLF